MMPAGAALQLSDAILLVANPDVPCLRNLQRLIDAREDGRCAKRTAADRAQSRLGVRRAVHGADRARARLQHFVQREQRLSHGRLGGELRRAGVVAARLGNQGRSSTPSPARSPGSGRRAKPVRRPAPGEHGRSSRQGATPARPSTARRARARATAAGWRRAARPCRARESS